MALHIPVGFAQLVYRFSLTGDPEPMVVTCGYDISGFSPLNQTQINALAHKFQDSTPAASLYSAYRFEGMTAYVGQASGPPAVWESSASEAFQGTASGEVLPQNCAYLVKKRTALAGRRNRGRMYVPPFWFSEATVDNTGRLTSAAVTAAQGRIDSWFSGNLWYLLHSDGKSATPAPTQITQFQVQQQIATQRRRLRT